MRKHAGFTLLELLIVIALLGVVTTMGLRAYGAMTARWNDTKATMEMHDAAGRALESIRRDLKAAPGAAVTGQGLLGQPGEARDENRFWGHELADDSIVIPAVDPEDPGRLQLVRYLVERGRQTPRLVRVASRDGQNGRVVIADGVLGFSVRFRAEPDGTWVSSWNHNRIPAQVAVNVVMMNPGNPQAQLVRREVVTLHVR